MTVILEVQSVSKAFPGVQALDQVRLDLLAGECHALLGENGAGKSTLIKILAGAHQPDAGTIRLCGEEVRFHSPAQAEAAGVSVIYQEFNLVPGLTARENLFLGRERTRLGFFSHKAEYRAARELFGRMNVPIDPETRCAELSVAQQQVVEIAKALAMDARLIIMDEPTAALTDQEVATLFAIIRDLKSRGIGVLYVSHRLDEVFEICDRATVMRDGRYIATRPVADLSRRELIEMMVGRDLESEFPARTPPPDDAPVSLRVEGLARDGVVGPCSFEVRRGEILALTGLVGAGRTELVRMIFGADRPTAGRVCLDDRAVAIRSPADAIRHGICLLTEDRKAQGLILNRPVRENFGLPNLGAFSTAGVMSPRREARAAQNYVQSLRIKLAGIEHPARNLSGGNQQKVVLAKWLERRSRVLIFDEPTRGIDVGAKFEIYQLMNQLSADGKAIVMISSELPEVLGMADRILVMRQGRIAGEIKHAREATQQRILELAMGEAQA